ncbi:class I SAM-dependent methyltransferase [Cochlodiniinecator piscidefendens]|uniref:class I SAM-dependent methyltransferase n=1 Tax=Cochlodiniinecator piscidefendens TaxID=2715756 RepID=UPI00140DC8C4|nr:SAM-dependent methyltransferase [Cochlodiniinecator piscidefendens]
MTPLTPILIERIQRSGPLSIADYMNECLLHPKYGYYATRDPFGAKGDFTTAPEISQMFGEVLGLCLAQAWIDQGSPDGFTLAEIGPGRGTLMADILRATKRVPGFHTAASIVLIDASPVLRDIQRDTLKDYDVHWKDSVSDFADAPLFLVANEFFDALPIRQYIRAGLGWRERQVGIKDNTLSFGTTAPLPIKELEARLSDTKDGDLVEICTPAQSITTTIAQHITRFGGVGIIIDYGDWQSLGDTLQALKSHAFDPPLAHPGDADLTAHVDFEALSKATTSTGCAITSMTPQGVLLERLGITTRAQQLAATREGDALENVIAAHRRLTHPEEMGTLFKAIALYPSGQTAPAGFTV